MDERRDPSHRRDRYPRPPGPEPIAGPADPGDDGGDRAPDRRFGLAELAETAGVSVRTVRYYIAEGLLPPPAGAGPRSAYTPGHLDRLRLIGRLKDAYLPLREIRRRLAGLDDAAVRALLARLGPPPTARPEDDAGDDEADEPSAPPDSAAAYLARVMGPRPPAAAPSLRALHGAGTSPSRVAASPIPPPAAPGTGVGDRRPPAELEVETGAPARYVAAASLEGVPWPDPELELDPALALLPTPVDAGEATAEGPWRRISLGPDAELLVREDAYRRRRDRIEWLLAWARKVFE